MHLYIIAVVCTVAVSGIAMSVLFHRKKLLDNVTIAAIALASVAAAVILPVVFSALTADKDESMDLSFLLISVISSLIVHLVTVFVLSIAIAGLMPKIKSIARKKTTETAAKPMPDGVSAEIKGSSKQTNTDKISAGSGGSNSPAVFGSGGSAGMSAEADSVMVQDYVLASEEVVSASEEEGALASEEERVFVPEEEDVFGHGDEDVLVPDDDIFVPEEEDVFAPEEEDVLATAEDDDAEAAGTVMAGDNYLEQIYLKYTGQNVETGSTPEEHAENTAFEENNIEKSVDSAENIGKMGIENTVRDEDITIEECIEEAFRLKELGDAEGSILYFMNALDRKPQKELTFWIILEICIMYKSLGQQKLALDILNSYYDIYSGVMDDAVRAEIERNLTEASA